MLGRQAPPLFAVVAMLVGAGGTAQSAPKAIVPVVVAGSAERTAEAATMLDETLRRSLAALGLDISLRQTAAMDVRDVAEPRRPFPSTSANAMRVWIDLGTARVAVVYITDGKSVFTRRFALGAGFDSVALDLLEVVITGSLEALLAGRPVGIPREEFTKTLGERPAADDRAGDQTISQGGNQPSKAGSGQQPQPSPDQTPAPTTQEVAAPTNANPSPPGGLPAAAPNAPPLRGAVGALYEAALLSSRQTVHGVGLVLQAQRDSARFGASVQGRLPYQRSGGGTTIELTSAGLRLFAGRGFSLGRTLTLIAGAALGADLNRVRTISTAGGLAPAAALWSLEPMVRPWLQLEARRGRFILGALVGVDLTLVESRYLIDRPVTAEPIWVPARWRPVAGLFVAAAL